MPGHITHDLGYLLGAAWLVFVALIICLPGIFAWFGLRRRGGIR